MKIKEKKYKIKKIKTSLNKKNQDRNNTNINNNNFNEHMEYEDDPEAFIKSKSINKIKRKNGFNLKKNNTLKLPLLTKSVNKNTNNNIETNETKFTKKNTLKKLNISTKDINNFNSNNKKSIKISKHSASAYKLKLNQKSMSNKKLHINKSANLGVARRLDRKIIKDKKIMMPKKGYKLFTTTKIINNFNNQINQNKNKEIYTMGNNINTNNDNTDNNNNKEKEIDVLYDFEKKISKIQNRFRKHLKDEDIHLDKVNGKKNVIIDVISDISLSDTDLNISKEESFDNINTSLDNEEIK